MKLSITSLVAFVIATAIIGTFTLSIPMMASAQTSDDSTISNDETSISDANETIRLLTMILALLEQIKELKFRVAQMNGGAVGDNDGDGRPNQYYDEDGRCRTDNSGSGNNNHLCDDDENSDSARDEEQEDMDDDRNDAEEEIDEAREAINALTDAINVAEEGAKKDTAINVVEEANILLDSAETAFDAGDYEGAEDKAKDAESDAKDAYLVLTGEEYDSPDSDEDDDSDDDSDDD